jgi:vacuolar-type H+-ATPase subunit D/Vma8
MHSDLEAAYNKVLLASKPQPADDELARLNKLLVQEGIDLARKDTYIKGLEKLVEELKSRVAALEKIVESEKDF